MKLSQLCIQRPVFSVVLSLVLILLGLLGYQQLDLRYQPTIFVPKLYVSVSDPGASAEQVEQTITQPLEDALAGTPDLDQMTSDSSAGSSDITLKFGDVSQAEFVTAQSSVMQTVSAVNLPDSAKRPEIHSADNGQNTVMFLGVSAPGHDQAALRRYVQNNIQKPMQQLPGVGGVYVENAKTAVRIALNPQALAEFKIPPSTILQKIQESSDTMSAGSLVSSDQLISITTSSNLPDLKAFRELIIAKRGGHFIKLGQLAHVFVGQDSISGDFTNIGGDPGIAMNIAASDNANPIEVTQAVKQKIQQLQQFLPTGYKITVVADLGSVLKQSVDEVYMTIIEAVILVVLITLLFLGTWRATLIPIVTIPVCLVASFAVMFVLGFSINVMTLLALVLAVGLVVDDAIVVLENNYRHIESGMKPLPAAKLGAKEISFAIIAMTICLIAVYVPTGFLSGKTAVYFRQFAFTLAACVLISGFVALTLSPMMCGHLLPYQTKPSTYEQRLRQFFDGLRQYYQQFLQGVFRYRLGLAVIFFVLLGCGYWALTTLPAALLPKSEMNVVVAFVQGPGTASANYVYKVNAALWRKIDAKPKLKNAINTYASFAGGSGGFGSNSAGNFISLKPASQRQLSADAFAKQLSQMINSMPGVRGGARVLDMNSNSWFDHGAIRFVVQGFTSYPQLAAAANELAVHLKKYPGFTDVDSELQFDSQQYDLQINQKMAATLNVPLSNITQAVNIFFGGSEISQGFYFDGVSYPVVVQLPRKDLADFSVLKSLYVLDENSQLVPLSRLVHIHAKLGLSSRMHNQEMRAATLSLNLNKGYSTGDAIAQILAQAKQSLPQGLQIQFMGQARDYLEGHHQITLIFVLGLIFIYLVLAALFESFIDPLVILLTVPLCIVGALLMLKLIGGQLNLYTGIGLVTLIGLVSKHGVLITQFANRLHEQGKSLQEAVTAAAAIRLRPILMTTATMVLGALPLVLASGPGATGRIQVGWVIIAGLLLGTVFSLLVVPVAYTILAKLKRGDLSSNIN